MYISAPERLSLSSMKQTAGYIPALLSCLAVFIGIGAAAQAPVFRNYTSTDGLPSSETYCAMQDSKGYMWFGTDRGLVKFNGYSFQSFTSSEGLTDNTVFSLFEDSSQRIWYHTYSGNIGYMYNDSSYSYAYSNQMNTVTQDWYRILPQKNGVWVNYKENRQSMVLYIDQAGNKNFSFNNSDSLTKNIYILDGYNNYQANLLSGKDQARHIRLLSLPHQKVLADFYTTKNIHNAHGLIHCLQKNGVLWLWVNGELRAFKNGICIFRQEKEERVLTIEEDARENIWIGYQYKGAELFEARQQYQNPKRFLNTCSVSGITCDNEGGLWFTTLENGIYYLPPSFGFSFDTRHGLPVSKTEQILNIDDHAVMLLSDKSVYVKQKGNAPVTPVLNNNWKGIQYILHNAPGTVYFSVLKSFPTKADLSLPFKKNNIFMGKKKLYAGKEFIWGIHGASLSKHNAENGKEIEQFSFDSIAQLTCVIESHNEDVLVGTLKGLYLCRQGEKRALKQYHPALGNRISDIRRLDSSHLLICTIGAGLLLFDENNYMQVVQYSVKDGLPSRMCNRVLPENDSTVWVATNRGLCCIQNIKKKSRAGIYTADVHDGIISNEIYDLCIIGNELWLATAAGVSVLSKSFLLNHVSDIPLYIEQVAVNGKIIGKNDNNHFPHHQNNISISFTGINYQYAERLMYKYRLKGIDENWSYTQNRNVIFNTLSPGSYIFEFKAIAPNLQESVASATYSFTITPAFWQTWWFRLMIILAGITGISLFVQYRIQTVRKQAWLNNELDRFRDKALRDQMNPHFIYNSLNSIQNYILKNDSRSSAFFLSTFSRLMRLTFNNTSLDRVSLEKDLEALVLYTEMENLGFREKFTFIVNQNLPVDASRVKVPPMILQPFVENAILHGLLAKNSAGNIWLDITYQNDSLSICIRDNGIGREEARVIKEKKSKYHTGNGERSSSGTAATQTRIEKCWGRNPDKAHFFITDLYDESGHAAGTCVNFCLPLRYD